MNPLSPPVDPDVPSGYPFSDALGTGLMKRDLSINMHDESAGVDQGGSVSFVESVPDSVHPLSRSRLRDGFLVCPVVLFVPDFPGDFSASPKQEEICLDLSQHYL